VSTVREQAIEAGTRAILRAYEDGVGSTHGGDEEFVSYVVDAVTPIIRADEHERSNRPTWSGYFEERRQEVEAEVRERIANQIEARCDRFSHRERIATPPEWPVCAKCMPYYNLALSRGEPDE
jgi:hypothetical protein